MVSPTSTENTNAAGIHGAQRTDGAQRTANFFSHCFPVRTPRTAAHTPPVPMEAPSPRSYFSGISAIFAHKKRTVAQPTFADFTDLAAAFSKLFEQQMTYHNKHRGNHQAIDPALAKEFCKTIVNTPKHRETVRYIIDSVAHGQTITDVMDQFEAQNDPVKAKNEAIRERNKAAREHNSNAAQEPELPLPFPEMMRDFVKMALESVFLQLPTAEHLKNTEAGIQKGSDDAVHKFAASLQAKISHQAMSLGMKLASACFPVLGVKTTLYIGSWFVPGMIKNITDAVAPQKVGNTEGSNSTFQLSNIHDAAQYVLSAFARLNPIKSALTEAVNTVQLSKDDEKRLVKNLWGFAGDLMAATDGTVDITKGPYKGWQLLEDNTVITSVGEILKESDPVSKDVLHQSTALREEKIESRRKEMLKVFKENIPFFREIFKSQNPDALVKELLGKSVLPAELQELVNENINLIFKSPDLTALMKSLLQAGNEEVLPTEVQQEAAKEAEEKGNARQAVLPPEMQKQKLVETGMGQLIDLIPGDELDGVAKLFTDTLNNFKPNKIKYFTAFKEELVGSLKSSERVKSLSQVADVLTTQYFSAIPIHKKRVMACAILSEGRPEFKPGDQEYRDLTDDSKTKFILAMTNKGGIGFQKAMQLFGDSVNDKVMSDALNEMKDSVKPLPPTWASNKYAAELVKINENLRSSAKIDGEYAQYKIKSFVDKPLKAATVGQVHKAIVDVTYHVRKENSVDVKGDKVEESKTIKNKPVVIKLLRENAMREVSVEMNALMSLPEVQKSPSVLGTLAGVKEGILEEVDFTIEKENGDLLHNIYRGEAYTSNNTKIEMKTAEVYAATSDMLIEELVQGSNFQELWYGKQKKDEEPKPVTYKENPASDDQCDIEIYSQRSSVEERFEFLDQWRLSVGLLARNWVSGMVNGASNDGRANLGGMGVIDSDRHSGNWMYDPYKKTVYIIDYGTITKIDHQQRAAMVNLTAAIFAHNANGVVDSLAELMRPAGKPVGDSPTATEFLRKRDLKFDDYQKSLELKGESNEAPTQVKVDKNRTLTTDIRDTILKRSEKEKHEDLLRALQNIGFLTSDTTLDDLHEMIPIEDRERPDSTGQSQRVDGLRSILKKSNKEVAAQQIITVLNGGRPQARPLTKIEDGRQKDLEKYLKTDSDDRLFNVARPNGSDQSRLLPASLSDANDELYFIRTIQKIANVLTDYGVSAPKSIVQLNRGTSFMRNHLHKNGYMKAVDEFLVAHKAELLKEPENRSAENATELTSKAQAKLDAMAAKLKNISLGDSFLSALLPQGMNTVMAVASHFAQRVSPDLSRPTNQVKSSYHALGDIFAFAQKLSRGVDTRLMAAGAVAAVGAVAYYNGDVTGIANAAGNVLAGAADQSASMLTDIAASMRNVTTYV